MTSGGEENLGLSKSEKGFEWNVVLLDRKGTFAGGEGRPQLHLLGRDGGQEEFIGTNPLLLSGVGGNSKPKSKKFSKRPRSKGKLSIRGEERT